MPQRTQLPQGRHLTSNYIVNGVRKTISSRPVFTNRELMQQRQIQQLQALLDAVEEPEAPPQAVTQLRPRFRELLEAAPSAPAHDPAAMTLGDEDEPMDIEEDPIDWSAGEPQNIADMAEQALAAAAAAEADDTTEPDAEADIEPEEEDVVPAEIPTVDIEDNVGASTVDGGSLVNDANFGDEHAWEDIVGSKPVVHRRSTKEMSLAKLAYAMWTVKHKIPRSAHESLMEIIPLFLRDPKTLDDIPKNVSSLKRHLAATLPLVSRRHRELEVAQLKLPSMTAAEKRKKGYTRTADLHWIEPAALIRLLLSSREYAKTMRQDFGVYVDNPEHMWESEAWQNSVRTTSGKFLYYPDGTPMFPSDFVYYKIPGVEGNIIGRIYGIGYDERTKREAGLEKGAMVVKVQRVCSKEKHPPSLRLPVRKLQPPLEQHELMLLEDQFRFVRPDAIVSRVPAIKMDHKFGANMGKLDPAPIGPFSDRIVRRVANCSRKEVRPAIESEAHIGELELEAYGRAWYLEKAKEGFISLPFLLFIDAFGLYRNMYRSLTGIYITFAGQTLKRRMQRANNFAIALGPHGSSLDDVLLSIRDLPALDKGARLRINGEEKTVLAFPLCMTGDMPQQNSNSGLMSQTANVGCRSCLVGAKDRADPNFDIVNFGRYHYHAREIRRRAMGMPVTRRNAWFRSWGMKDEEPALCKIFPALDTFASRPADVCHSEYYGQGKASHALLMDAILEKTVPRGSPPGTLPGTDRYHQEFVRIPSPHAWRRRQSPKHHLQSWSMSEAGIATLLTPLILKSMELGKADIKHGFWLAAEQNTMLAAEMERRGWDVSEILIYCYCTFALSAALTCAPSISWDQRINADTAIAAGRAFFRELCNCAANAAEAKRALRLRTALSEGDEDGSSASDDASSNHSDDETVSQTTAATNGVNKTGGKMSEYSKWAHRPNAHQGRHISSIMRRYGIAYNCNVLSGEDKHRQYKDEARAMNGTNPVKDLMHSESVNLTLRLLLLGAYDYTEPQLSQNIRELRTRCPALTAHFSPRFDGDELAEESSETYIIEDELHTNAKTSRMCDPDFVKNKLGLPLDLGKLPITHPFLNEMREAYETHYNSPHMVHMGGQSIDWFSTISFSDPARKRRITISTADCYLDNQQRLCKFELGFVHRRYPDEARFFAIISVMADAGAMDTTVNLPLKKAVEQRVVGLPAIGSKLEYVLDLRYKDYIDTVAKIDKKFKESLTASRSLPPLFPSLVHVTWNIGLM